MLEGEVDQCDLADANQDQKYQERWCCQRLVFVKGALVLTSDPFSSLVLTSDGMKWEVVEEKTGSRQG